MTFNEKATSEFGSQIMACSSVMDLEPTFERWYPGGGTILEIGTYNGLSSAFFSWHFDRVITIDVKKQPQVDQIWERLARPGIVEAWIVAGNPHKKQLVEGLSFDFAFVDGDHSRAGCLFDYEIVKRCGAVLFHDYDRRRYMRVVHAVNSLKPPATDLGNRLALWLRGE